MAFGIYVHIPYCLQHCVYCDFSTTEINSTLSRKFPPNEYVTALKTEIASKGSQIGPRQVDSIYFGGGTPSLLKPRQLHEILQCLTENGFPIKNEGEITLEINPDTLTMAEIKDLRNMGFNRYSVGAQTFNDRLLKVANRKHSTQDTIDTLSLLADFKVNYSMDILFGLPTQTLEDLAEDLEITRKFNPPHVSPYCLTVPQSNPLSQNRPTDDVQVEMFALIEKNLIQIGLNRYEISNFSKPDFESRHNLIYWNDQEYWGIGVSSHSYLHIGPWGTRFWNSQNLADWFGQISLLNNERWQVPTVNSQSSEVLTMNQALTDFFHTSLRKKRGLSKSEFMGKFKRTPEEIAKRQLDKLNAKGLLAKSSDYYFLTAQGVLLSNQVFEELTFLTKEISEIILN